MKIRKPRQPDPPPYDEEDTPEKIAWFIENVRRRRAEFGWIEGDEA